MTARCVQQTVANGLDNRQLDRDENRCEIQLATDPVAGVFEGHVVFGINGAHGQPKVLLGRHDAHLPPIYRLFGPCGPIKKRKN